MNDFPIFDADNHYYEARDAFTRHLDPKMGRRAMQWATVDGKERLLVAGSVNHFIPNPTFERVSRPGALADYFAAKSGVTDMRAAFGELDPIADRPEYRNRDARLGVMDEQGLDACIMLPTLGVGMEAALEHDPEALTAAFGAFNRWLDEDWGYAYQERIFAAPYITLVDVNWAVAELDRALTADARVVLMRPAAAMASAARRTPGDPAHDAFWARMNESGATVVIHGGDSSYGAYQQLWGLSGDVEAFRQPVLTRMLSASPIHDMVASLLADRLFDRFPNLRIATIETGSAWVRPLLKKLRTLAIQMPHEFGADPSEQFLDHVWVSPFFEDDVLDLVDCVGAPRVVFGSDWPHAEGLEDPASFRKELASLADDDVRRIMHDNAASLVVRRPA